MFYKLATDFVITLHFLWILFIIFGAFWGRYNRIVRNIHIASLVFSIISQIFSVICPLTHLEVWLEKQYDPSLAYPGSFITHYLEELVYIQMSEKVIFLLTLVVVGMSGVVYWKTFHRKG